MTGEKEMMNPYHDSMQGPVLNRTCTVMILVSFLLLCVPAVTSGASIVVEEALLQTDTNMLSMQDFITGSITVTNLLPVETTVHITLNACSTSGDLIPVGTQIVSLPIEGREQTSIVFSPQNAGFKPGEYIFLATALPSDAINKSDEGDVAFVNQREIFNIV